MNKALLTFVLLLIFSCGQSHGADYYVSTSGSGSAACGIGTPCTFTRAQSVASSGDRIYFRGGRYTANHGLPWYVSKSNITLQAYPDETPILDGDTNSDGTWDIPNLTYPNVSYVGLLTTQTAATYVTIDGFTVQHSRGRGIDSQFGSHTTIRNCNVNYTNHTSVMIGQIGVDSYDVLENSSITYGNYCADTGVCSEWQYIQQGVILKGGHNTVRNSSVGYCANAGIEGYLDYNSTIEDNVVYGNYLTQIHVAESRESTIQNNLIYGTTRSSPNVNRRSGYGDGVAVQCELWYSQTANNWDQGHVVRNNLIANCKAGLVLGWQTGKNSNYASNVVHHNYFYNNTIMETYHPNSSYLYNIRALVVRDDGHIGAGNEIKNNIFWQSDTSKDLTVGNASDVDIDYNMWNRAPTSTFRGTHDPTYSSYPTLNKGTYYTKTTGWYGSTIDYGEIHESDFSLRSTAYYAIDRGLDVSLPYYGSAPDCGGVEYSTGSPYSGETMVYNLAADGNDSDDTGTDYDLTGYNTPVHTGGGLEVDDITDGYYYGDIQDVDSSAQVMSAITCFSIDAISGSFQQPIAGRFDYNGLQNWSMGVWKDGRPFIMIGHSGGTTSEYYYHGTTLSTGTNYYFWMVVDGYGKTLRYGLVNSSGDTIGTDLNVPILSGRTWNYSEENLLIGYTRNNGAIDTNYFTHGDIYHVEIQNDSLSKTDILQRVTDIEGGSAQPSPEITTSCFCDQSGGCLSGHLLLTTPGQRFYFKIIGSEQFLIEGGAGALDQITAEMTQSISMRYYSGYNTNEMIFYGGTAHEKQKFGWLYPVSISEGTDNIIDSESNDFDISGIDTSPDYFYIFSVSPRRAGKLSRGGMAIVQSTNAQKMEQ